MTLVYSFDDDNCALSNVSNSITNSRCFRNTLDQCDWELDCLETMLVRHNETGLLAYAILSEGKQLHNYTQLIIYEFALSLSISRLMMMNSFTLAKFYIYNIFMKSCSLS